MTPNNVDLPTLTSRWIEFTNRIEDGAKQLQDHAYALGYVRSRLDAKPMHDELVEALRNGIQRLEGVLCDPNGEAVISGSDGDRAEVNDILGGLRAVLAKLPEGR